MDPQVLMGLIVLVLVAIYVMKAVFKMALRRAVLIGIVIFAVLYYMGAVPFSL